MSGGADLFRVLTHTESVGVLASDTRPALVVDRSGQRLLWANAAGAAFFGVTTVDKLTALRFSAASPFARRITALDDMLVSGQDRIERLPLQRGLLPRPTVCKASRVVADGIKAILLTVVDGAGSLAGDPASAFAALAATALPARVDLVPSAGDAATEVVGLPAGETTDQESVVDKTAPDAMAESGDATAEQMLPDSAEIAETIQTDQPQVAPVVVEVEADAEPSISDATAEVVAEDVQTVPAEPAPEEARSESVEETEADGEIAAPEETDLLPEAEPAAVDTDARHAVSEPAEELVEDVATASPQDESAPSEDEPAFAFPSHGRPVRFVFELDPLLAFTFVSADLAATVGPGMADILGRTWGEVAGRLEFDPAGRIAEALGRGDTFTGLTVDWPVDGQKLRVPTDLAGMPVFGRERAFRGYRGFGVLKTGAAFEAPVPAEPIAASEPDPSTPLPVQEEDTPDNTDDRTAVLEAASEAELTAVEQLPNAELTSPNDLASLDEPAPQETELLLETPEAEAPEASEAEAVPESAVSEPQDLSDEARPELLDEPDEISLAPDESMAAEPKTEAPDQPVAAIPDLADIDAAEMDDIADETFPDEPDVVDEEPIETEQLAEPLPLVTPPAEEDTADMAELPAPSVTEVAPSPETSHHVGFTGLTSDKARALSKPERDAFDKIAEALADAFGPRILADPANRAVVPTAPVVERKAETPAESGPTVDIALLDKLPVALAILRGGDIIHANRAFLDLCGYPDVAAIDREGGFAQVFEGSALNRDAAIPAIRRRDGVEIPVSARLHSMPMEGGIASLLVVQETVATTSRDRLATAEQRAEDMEAILDTATDGVLVLDHKGLVIGANKSAEALFGNERSHMIGMAFVDLLAPESHRSALDYLDGLSRNALSSVLNDGREVIGRVAGGGLVPLFMTVGRVSATKFCAVLRDITQWKRAEEELTSAKKAAENASSQKSDFLAKMSHEIRTPLNAIIGFSEVMMEERFGPVGNDRYKEYLRDIHVSGTHIMSLVNDLLDLSKIEAGKLELTFEAVGLNDVVRECAALMQPQANRERIIIRTSLSSSLPPVVADNRSLRQIILNLLSNAVKFNAAGGQVIVSTLYEESGEVVLRVRDTGQGMSEGDIVKAMEPFRQLSTSRTGGGTGLGLPLTKALVEANRAAFQIDSTPGQGTMVQITFPSTRVLAE